MNLRAFLYRRLCRFVTCQIRLPGGGCIKLDNKYQVASFQDVFLDPNYWRVFSLFQQPPGLIVDCGAHCGHFAILAEVCLRARFQTVGTDYILIEPNTDLLPTLERNLASSGLASRARVVNALVGPKSGAANLQTDGRNFLVSKVEAGRTSGRKVAYTDVANLIGDRRIDLLKLDVEGAEFQFAAENPDVMNRTDNVIVEVHSDAGSLELFSAMMAKHGLHQSGAAMQMYGNYMTLYTRSARVEDSRQKLEASVG